MRPAEGTSAKAGNASTGADGGSPRSESTALELSLVGTGLAWGVLAAGVALESGGDGNELMIQAGLVGALLAPTMGHWYAGRVVTPGLGLRLLGAAGAAYGLLTAIGCEDGCGDNAELLFYGGALTVIAGTVYDIVAAPRAARRRNQELVLRSIGVAPMATRHGGGLAIGVRF